MVADLVRWAAPGLAAAVVVVCVGCAAYFGTLCYVALRGPRRNAVPFGYADLGPVPDRPDAADFVLDAYRDRANAERDRFADAVAEQLPVDGCNGTGGAAGRPRPPAALGPGAGNGSDRPGVVRAARGELA